MPEMIGKIKKLLCDLVKIWISRVTR